MGVLILLSVAIFNVGLTLLAELTIFTTWKTTGWAERITWSGLREMSTAKSISTSSCRIRRVETAETDEFVMMDMASFPEGGVISANFPNMDRSRKIGGYFVAEQTEVPKDEAVYIPVFMKDMGYGLGMS